MTDDSTSSQIEVERLGEDRIDREKLRQTPKEERRIALILAPGADPGLAKSAIGQLRRLASDGYHVTDIPVDGEALIRALREASSNNEETFSRGEYGFFFAALPRLVQERIAERWGVPERDSLFRESRLTCGDFALPAIRCGNIVVAMHPLRGGDIDPNASQPASELPPPHGYLAFYAWLIEGVRVQAIVHLREPDQSIAF